MTITIERAAEMSKPPQKPIYSPFGYVIQPDGTTYALVQRWTHGLILALLYPELAAKFTERELDLDVSLGDVNVFAFQAFELAHHGEMPVIRICDGRMAGPPSIDLPPNACTPEQKEALRLALDVLCYDSRTEINTDMLDMPVSKLQPLLDMTKAERMAHLFTQKDDAYD